MIKRAFAWPLIALAVVGLLVLASGWRTDDEVFVGWATGDAPAPATDAPARAADASPSATARRAPRADEAASRLERYDLETDEQLGGHTLERHVGIDEEGLKARLRRERRISAASSYADRATAERVVAVTLARERTRLGRWTARRGNRPNLALDYEGTAGEVIGHTLRRSGRRLEPCHDAVVVLTWHRERDRWFVLTSYPEIRR